jgi:hypothetical protein
MMRSHQPMAAADPAKKAFLLMLSGARPEIAARALRAGLAVLLDEPPALARAANGSDHRGERDGSTSFARARPRRKPARRAGKRRKAKAARGRPPKQVRNGTATLSATETEADPLSEAEMSRIRFLISTHAAGRLGPTLIRELQADGAALDAAAVAKVRAFLNGPI